MVFVKVMVFCWFLTKNRQRTVIFPTYGFGMVLINFSCVLKVRLRVIISSACIKQRQLKIERALTVLTRAMSWTLSGFENTFTLEKRLKIETIDIYNSE